MMVSPSNPQPVVVAVWSKVSVLYEVLSLPAMLMYALVFTDWIEPAMLKYSLVAAGPRTTMDA